MDATTALSSDGAPTERTALSRAVVIAAAVELADEVGIGPLTIRRLADRLGVRPMSIYHYVAGKDEILDGMVDAVFAEMALPPDGLDWKEAMRVRARSARVVLARHPWATPLLDGRTSPGPATLRHHDAVIGCLRGAGFSLALTAHAFTLLDAHLYGFVLQEQSLVHHDAEDLAAVGQGILDRLPEGELPHFRELALGHALLPGYDHGAEFDEGLDLVLDGLARRLDQPSPRGLASDG